MEPMTARALLTLRLSPEQREKLREHEKSLPPGRYLTGFEILRSFPQVKGGEVPEDQTLEIDQLYREWERRILWKTNELENNRHDRVCIPRTGPWCKCRTRQEEVHEWEDWFIDNYDKAPTERDWRIPHQVFSRVSAPQQTGVGKDRQTA
jgi:hypothetical protein